MTNVRVTVFDGEQYDGDWPPANALQFMAWFTAKLSEIPEEYRSDAMIELDSVSSYEDTHYVRIVIVYDRPETAAEKAGRHERAQARKRAAEQQELRELERLKKKYEGGK